MTRLAVRVQGKDRRFACPVRCPSRPAKPYHGYWLLRFGEHRAATWPFFSSHLAYPAPHIVERHLIGLFSP